MATQQCQQVIVDVFSDRGGVELLKAIVEGDSSPPNPLKDQVFLGVNAKSAA